MRVAFFGMTGQFSVPPLERLLAAGVDVCAVVVPAAQLQAAADPRRMEPAPASASGLPLVDSYVAPNIIHLAWQHNIPVWQVGSLANRPTLALLESLRPRLIAVACFTLIFPPPLLQLPPHGCLNLHPSLLPAYRGPAPLFWIARNNEPDAGVTLHFLDEALDAGDIVAQTSVGRLDGITGAELEQRCAQAGADLLLEAVRQLERGQALPRHSQPEAGASYFPWPCESDFEIPTDWPARRAFNFLRGAEGWPLVVNTGDTQFNIRVAINYSADHSLEQSYILLGDELWVQFSPGVLRAKIYPH